MLFKARENADTNNGFPRAARKHKNAAAAAAASACVKNIHRIALVNTQIKRGLGSGSFKQVNIERLAFDIAGKVFNRKSDFYEDLFKPAAHSFFNQDIVFVNFCLDERLHDFVVVDFHHEGFIKGEKTEIIAGFLLDKFKPSISLNVIFYILGDILRDFIFGKF